MAQKTAGSVYVKSGSTKVVGHVLADWTGVATNHWIAVVGDNVSYNVASIVQWNTGTASAYNGGTTYNIGDISVSGGDIWVSTVNSNTGNLPEISPAQWTLTSGWEITLSVAYAGSDQSGSGYAIVIDFTNKLSLPLLAPGDIEIATFWNRAMNLIDDVAGPQDPVAMAALDVDWSLVGHNGIFTKTLSGNSTFTFSNTEDGKSIEVVVVNTTYTLAWPTVTWVGGVAPVISLNATDRFIIRKVGSIFYGQHLGSNKIMKPSYGTQTALTVSGLDSLADATVATSDAVDNATVKAQDYLVEIYIDGTAAANAFLEVRLAIASDGGTNYGTWENAKPLGIIDLSTDLQRTSFSLVEDAGLFQAPEDFKIMIKNSTGAALAASGNTCKYQTLNVTSS